MIADVTAYDVDPVRGFLPARDPLTRLPAAFDEWESIAAELPALIVTGKVRQRLSRLTTPALSALEDVRQRERAFLLISALGTGYVWGVPEPVDRIPAAVAVPWHALAGQLGRPPIVTHASFVLNNWRRVDPDGPICADNVTCLQHFLGGMDEQWFFTIAVEIEATGGPALVDLATAQRAVQAGDRAVVKRRLTRVASVLDAMLAALLRVYEKCDPRVFYLRVRPFLTGWDQRGLIYEGVSDEPIKLCGGSAAQSSLIQALDAGLGIEHLHPDTRPFLTRMRDYMPPRHRRFIEHLAAAPSLRDYVAREHRAGPLRDAYNACIDGLDALRKAHQEIAVRYILRQTPDGEASVGTGGTSFVPFLGQARKETRARKLKPD